MASSTSLVDTLEKELECSICLNTYTNPKTLPCLHTFCCHCLDELAEKSRENRQQIACPDCRTQIDLPQGTTFDVFPTAFFLNRLKDIVSVQSQENQVQCGSCDNKSKVVAFCLNCKCFICIECQDLHSKLKVWKGHRVTSVEQIQDVQEILRTPQLCQEEFHDNADLEYFCQTCQKCVCQKCTTVTHKNHELQHLKQAAEHAKSRLEETQTKVQERADVWREQMNKDNETHTKTKQRIQQTREAIENNEQRLIELVKQHTKKLLTEVDEIEKNQETKFQQHTDNMELHLAQLNSITEYLHSVSQRGICEEILGAKPAALSRAKEILDVLNKYKALKNVFVEFQPDEDVCRQIEHSPLGWVHVRSADPKKTQMQGLETKQMYKDHQSQFTVVTKDTEDNICYSASEHVSVQILSSAGDEVETEVEDRKDGTYTVCFTPNTKGVHHVTVRVGGQTAANSSLGVHVTKRRPTGYRAEATFGSRGSGKGQFQYPTGIAVNRAGEVAVTDSNNHRVQIFSADGQYLREFGAKGTADGQLSFPTGLAYNKAGHIVVADRANSRIQVFRSTGRWISKFGQDVLKEPWGVSVTSDDYMVVCDSKKNTVNVFTQDGVLLLKFVPSPGTTPQYAILFDKKYFVSLSSHVIKVFDSRGSYLYDIGERGNREGQFLFPYGLAVDTDDLLLVCDRNNRVQVVTLDGEFVTSFGSYGSELDQFNFPRDITVTSDGRLFVCDEGNYRIMVFQPQY